MSVINPAILYAVGLAAIPVILHLLLRAKPKKLFFPALQLIQARRQQNVRRLRLRHLWLLLLRIAAIAAIVFALARPTLPAANYALNLKEMLIAGAILAMAFGAYWATVFFWRRKRLPNHVIAYRRTLLVAGSALSTLVLLSLLVGWPYLRRVTAEVTAPMPEVAEDLPASAVFLFDTSLSMQYRIENQTRLDVAKEIAVEHLTRLPARSRVAITDTSTDSPVLYQADLAGAQSRAEGLEILPVSHALNDRLRAALALLEEDRRRTLDSEGADADQRDRYLREVYVFTDLSRSAWSSGAGKGLRDELDRLAWANLYLIDVGVTEPVNVGLTALRLSKQSIPLGGRLFVDATLTATGLKDTDRTVEISMEGQTGQPVKKGQRAAKLGSGSVAQISFSPIDGLTGPISHGSVRLVSSDPFPADDVRYLTAEVQPPLEVLLVAPAESDVDYLRNALAPGSLAMAGRAPYRCTYLASSRLAGADLSPYAVICLVSVPTVPEAEWDMLGTYVESGGGLAVFLGTFGADTAVSYNTSAAQSLLPAEVVACLKFMPPESLDLRESLSHPVFRRLDELQGVAVLTSQEVRRYWKVEPNDGASIIARYSDARRSPALLERVHGEGRSVMLTTSVDLKDWNDLPRVWAFLVFADRVIHHLSRRTDNIFNYTAGDEVVFRLAPDQNLDRYLLRKPGLQQLPGEVPAGARLFSISETDQLGHFDVIPAGTDSDFTTGFSVNTPAAESDFTRLTEPDLDGLFGEKRYGVARDIEGLTRGVTRGRFGQEICPFVLLLAIVFFCGEHLVANWFHQTEYGG